MKILGRITYALIAGIIFIYLLSFSDMIIAAKYFEKYGPEAVSTKDDEFFYGGSGFHKKEVMFKFSENGYYINIYEINRLFVHNKTNDKRVDEYLYIIIYDDNKIINPTNEEEYFLSFYNEVEDIYLDVSIRRFRELDVFVAVYLDSNEMSTLLSKEAFLNQDLTTITIIHENVNLRETLFEKPFSISEEDFVIADVLLNHYESRNDYGVYDIVEHSISEFQSTKYLVIGIYMGVLIIATYFIFFFDIKKFRKTKSNEQRK